MSKKSGFSLIEMLVAVAVFAILLTILAGSYSGIERAISQASARREANATGRAFYICWCGSWKDAAMRVTADPAARDQIVAVCRPGEL